MRSALLSSVSALALLLSACAHRSPMTIITTRQNGTIKLCGKIKEGRMVTGESAEGSPVSVNPADIVTMEQIGTCKR